MYQPKLPLLFPVAPIDLLIAAGWNRFDPVGGVAYGMDKNEIYSLLVNSDTMRFPDILPSNVSKSICMQYM